MTLEQDPAGRTPAANDAVLRRIGAGAQIAAGGLIGFGVICWIAANWDSLSKFGKFGLVGGLIVVAGLFGAAISAVRVPALLTALMATGALLALVGQTYQSGADAWQLFALWMALGLPLALAARHDAVWVAWVITAFAAIPLWTYAVGGRSWNMPVSIAWIGWGLSFAIAGFLWPRLGLGRWIGETGWAFRLAVILALGFVGSCAVPDLFWSTRFSPLYWSGLGLIGAVALALYLIRPLEIALLAAAALAVDGLLIVGLAKVLFMSHSSSGDKIGQFLFLGLVSAGIVAGSAVLLVRIVRGSSAETDAGATAPAAAVSSDMPAHSWPVVVLSGIGALIAAVPLMTFLMLSFGSVLSKGPGTYFLGPMVLAGGLFLLRTAKPLGFGQQFGFIAMVVGFLLVAFGVSRDLSVMNASLVMALLNAGVALVVGIGWVRSLLGAASAAFTSIVIAQLLSPGGHFDGVAYRIAWTLLAFSGAAALVWLGSRRDAPGVAGAADPAEHFVLGWAAAGLVGLVAASGPTFMLGTSWDSGGGVVSLLGELTLWDTTRILSVMGAVAGCGLLLQRYPALRAPVVYGAGVVAIVLSAVSSGLGAGILMLAAAIVAGSRVLAILAGIACLWILGAFYYWLGWPLVNKAYLLVGLGLALGAVCIVAGWGAPTLGRNAARPTLRSGLAAGLIGISTFATAGIVTTTVMQKETLLKTGRIVYIALQPVDPRSLMQGDYMALRFAMPSARDAEKLLEQTGRPLKAVGRVDAQNVAVLESVTDGAPTLRADQILLDLKLKNGRWIAGTDAWFFKEGTGQRFEAAKFGVFRVATDGQNLLAGMADGNLKLID